MVVLDLRLWLALFAIVAAIPLWLAIRKRWRFADVALVAIVAIAPVLWRAPLATLFTAATLIAAFGVGDRLCRWLRIEPDGIVLPFALGLGAWVLITTALAVAGLIYAPVVAIAIVLGAAIGVRPMCRVVLDATHEWKEPSAIAGMSIFFLALMILVLQPVMLAPSTLYDPLSTHLVESRLLALHHILPTGGEYGYLPQGFELMMGAAATIAGQAAEQMIAPMFLGLLLLALYAIAREFGARRDVSIAAAVLALSIPVVQWTGANVKNDVPVAFFLLVALLASARAFFYPRPGWIIASAFLAAASENIKHTGLLGAGALAILLLAASLRLSQHRARTIAAAIMIFLVCGGFWWTRSAIAHHDAMYPAHSPDGSGQSPSQVLPMRDRLAFVASLPFKGMPVYEGTSTTRLGLLFFLFLPGVFWIARRDANPKVLTCALFVAIYLALWFVTLPVLRYAIAPVALLGVGLVAVAMRAPAPAVIVVMIVCHLATFSNMLGMSINMPRLKYVARLMSDDAYLDQALPEYPALHWLRDHASPDASILAFGTHAICYAPDPERITSPMNEDGPFDPNDVRTLVGRSSYQYVIITKKANPAVVFGEKTPAFADSNFAVFSLR